MKSIQMMPRRSLLRAFGALSVTAALLLAGCGGSSSDDGDADSPDSGDRVKLTVAISAVDPSQAIGYLAEAKGFYDEAGVDVTIIPNAGTNVPNMLVSGQADLGWSAAAAMMTVAMQGKDAQTVYAPNGGAPAGTLVVNADSGITDISQLDGKRIGVTGPGSTTWGYAAIIADVAGIKVDLAPLGTVPSEVAAVGAGQVEGAVGSYGSFLGLIDEDKVNVLVDTRDPEQREQYLGPDWPDGAIFGLASNLEDKREAVTRFLTAINKTVAYAETATDDQMAKDLRTLTDWEPFSEDSLTRQIQDTKGFWSPNGGQVSEEDFEYIVKQLGQFDIPGYDADNPAFTYEDRVDMSYLDASEK